MTITIISWLVNMQWYTSNTYAYTCYLNAGFRTIGKIALGVDKVWIARLISSSTAPDVVMPHSSLSDAQAWLEAMAKLKYGGDIQGTNYPRVESSETKGDENESENDYFVVG